MIDWAKFAQHIPTGTMVKINWIEGMLMENSPYYALDRNAQHRAEMLEYEEGDEDRNLCHCHSLRWQRTNVQSQYTGWTLARADELSYLIDDRWQTFDEIMGLS
jgi:hypothetical protein